MDVVVCNDLDLDLDRVGEMEVFGAVFGVFVCVWDYDRKRQRNGECIT
jgi:hypothetical protein